MSISKRPKSVQVGGRVVMCGRRECRVPELQIAGGDRAAAKFRRAIFRAVQRGLAGKCSILGILGNLGIFGRLSTNRSKKHLALISASWQFGKGFRCLGKASMLVK